MKKEFIILICISAAVVLLLYIMFVRVEDNQSNGIEWHGEQQIDRGYETEYIAIPGISDMSFVKNQTSQYVNIHNPKENNCSMNFSLVMDDGFVLWSETNIQPGYGLYKIAINKLLPVGQYNCLLVVECFSQNGSPLNGCTLEVKVVVR